MLLIYVLTFVNKIYFIITNKDPMKINMTKKLTLIGLIGKKIRAYG